MIDAVQPHMPDQNKVDGNDEVQQPRHNQDQDARDEGNDRRNVCGRKGHYGFLGRGIISSDRAQACALTATTQRIRNDYRLTVYREASVHSKNVMRILPGSA
jgi:hypothetical protein